MELIFLGGARKIGNSSIGLSLGNDILLLDYGASPSHGNPPELPIKVDPMRVIGVVITHAHVDHSGAVPWLFKTAYNPPVIATPLTLELSDLLLRDELKLSGKYLPFGFPELQRMMSSGIPIRYNSQLALRDNVVITLHNAGHIPGSASVVVEVDGKKIWYTSDINTIDCWLTTAADIVHDADIVIMEATYSYKDHPDRKTQERALVETANKVSSEGGACLIPAFSIARSQEVLITLIAHDFAGPIVLDGMSQAATNIMLSHPDFINNWYALKRASERAKWMRSKKERKKYVKMPSAIIAPAGMLLGGWSKWYLKKVFGNEKNAILFVSYQVPGTLGYKVLHERVISHDGKEVPVSAFVDYFDLSSHAGKTQLKQIASQLESPEKIFLVHGEEPHISQFAEEFREETGIDVVVPNVGEVYKL
ncbi:MAG: MBL fold metallo-hydrolase [Crenarchaeota archaeon]|nr:MBL fold metallo-hydrolase [Thermoproteota archaeon]MCR8455526.1 MBL fold metallo-hydrolase [Thermoproteota archaeon]MCR8463213.1 MBL fold metallo-hydrolase [Thermoproteota archaeon]MCR8473323.1 MBL fold metallo-hydrolase [Thermoproteota archaeon]MCR8501684.1 MBL fold metallo-hydrolase [Thermoproteota archaeon]